MTDELVERFVREAELNGTTVELIERDGVRERVQELVAGRAALVDPIALLDGVELPVPPADAWDAEIGVSEAFVGAAESGTVVLPQRPGSPRRTSLLVQTHVVLLARDALLPTYQDAVDAAAALRPRPIGVQFVSGHSRSGDIESAMIHGMHGPAELIVLLHS
ncbi:MAG TPA: LUD domain-containing protein [Propionibacteriaceae bacterium]|nr:LUD domain-containing protein [Propionibacteriaceae bacterium]